MRLARSPYIALVRDILIRTALTPRYVQSLANAVCLEVRSPPSQTRLPAALHACRQCAGLSSHCSCGVSNFQQAEIGECKPSLQPSLQSPRANGRTVSTTLALPDHQIMMALQCGIDELPTVHLSYQRWYFIFVQVNQSSPFHAAIDKIGPSQAVPRFLVGWSALCSWVVFSRT